MQLIVRTNAGRVNTLRIGPSRGPQGPQGIQGVQGPKGDPGTTDYNELQNLPDLTLKADKSDTYTKSEVDTSLSGKADLIHVHTISNVTGLQATLYGKQANLVSGTNIKTINGEAILGAGDIIITGGGGTIDGGSPSSELPPAPEIIDGGTV